jgi:hypothetical protein
MSRLITERLAYTSSLGSNKLGEASEAWTGVLPVHDLDNNGFA